MSCWLHLNTLSAGSGEPRNKRVRQQVSINTQSTEKEEESSDEEETSAKDTVMEDTSSSSQENKFWLPNITRNNLRGTPRDVTFLPIEEGPLPRVIPEQTIELHGEKVVQSTKAKEEASRTTYSVGHSRMSEDRRDAHTTEGGWHPYRRR